MMSANTNAYIMPVRPPISPPIHTNNKVSAVSNTAVLKIFMLKPPNFPAISSIKFVPSHPLSRVVTRDKYPSLKAAAGAARFWRQGFYLQSLLSFSVRLCLSYKTQPPCRGIDAAESLCPTAIRPLHLRQPCLYAVSQIQASIYHAANVFLPNMNAPSPLKSSALPL